MEWENTIFALVVVVKVVLLGRAIPFIICFRRYLLREQPVWEDAIQEHE